MRRAVAIVVVVMIAGGCARASPAGFWSTYRPDLIKDKDSDQGPWGGVRWIHWTSPTPGTFRSAEVLKFARSKGCSREIAIRALSEVGRNRHGCRSTTM
jgi:hypothetical protein